MSRYIDAELLPNLFDAEYKKTLTLIKHGEVHLDNIAEGFTEAHQVVMLCPTADVQEVRHGKWIKDKGKCEMMAKYTTTVVRYAGGSIRRRVWQL